MSRAPGENDSYLTIRVPRGVIALVVATLLHVAAFFAIAKLLPEAKKPPQKPIEMSIAPSRSAPPPPSAAAPAPTPPAPKVAKNRAPRTTSPVSPVLPASEAPPENRAQLPVAEAAPDPAPPPKASSFWEQQEKQLKATRPKLAQASGPLAPSFNTLDGVAFNDPRLHDEENERRMMADNGAFFRRGLEALRSSWHPGQVLDAGGAEVIRRCGRQDQMTYAVAVLDKQGNVVDVDLKTPSNCPELDREAIAAFKRVARFPHPPPDIFKAPDGSPVETARYPVRFIVTFNGGLRLDWN